MHIALLLSISTTYSALNDNSHEKQSRMYPTPVVMYFYVVREVWHLWKCMYQCISVLFFAEQEWMHESLCCISTTLQIDDSMIVAWGCKGWRIAWKAMIKITNYAARLTRKGMNDWRDFLYTAATTTQCASQPVHCACVRVLKLTTPIFEFKLVRNS